jgi:hypothetical protein
MMAAAGHHANSRDRCNHSSCPVARSVLAHPTRLLRILQA